MLRWQRWGRRRWHNTQSAFVFGRGVWALIISRWRIQISAILALYQLPSSAKIESTKVSSHKSWLFFSVNKSSQVLIEVILHFTRPDAIPIQMEWNAWSYSLLIPYQCYYKKKSPPRDVILLIEFANWILLIDIHILKFVIMLYDVIH